MSTSSEARFRNTIRELLDQDIPSLTRMWNESDEIWPGGFTSGMPLTVDRLLRWHYHTDYLSALVAVEDNTVVGFCGLTRLQGDPTVAYISVLGVHPSVLGRGYGRDLLRTAVARATTLGFRRLDLDTWSANTRALPLYKRVGFCWVPGTSANMQNFLPLLLRQELLREFLADADWYRCYRPHVSLSEDSAMVGNLPVFRYVFEREGLELAMHLAVSTGELVGYEDQAVRVATEAAHRSFIVGVPQLVRWRIERKDAQPGTALPVSLFVQGRGGVAAERAITCEVVRAATLEVEAVATRAAAEPLPVAAARPGLDADLAIGHKTLRLGASLPAVPSLEAFVEPPEIAAVPDKPIPCWLGVRNRLPTPAKALLQLTTCGDYTLTPQGPLAFDLAAGEAASVAVEICAPAGLHILHVAPLLIGDAAEATLVAAGTAEAHVVAGGPSDAFAYRTQAGAVLENAHLRATLTARGGRLRLQTKNPEADLVEQSAVLGPPFWPSEFAHREFDVQVDVREGRASVHLAAESSRYPGLIFRRTVTVTASPRLAVEFSLANTNAEPYRLAVRVDHMMRLHSSLIAVPLAEGLLVDSAEAAEWEGGAPFPECYAETWASLEREDLTVGFLWPEGSLAEFSRRYGPAFMLPEVTVPAGGNVAAGELVLYAGAGGWRAVRDQWRRLFNAGAPERPPQPVRAAQIAIQPPFVAWSGKPVDLELHARHLRARALNGRARLSLPPGWLASTTEWEVSQLRRGEPQTYRTELAPAPQALAGTFPPADEATLFLDADLALGRQQLALLVLGRPGGEVDIREQPLAGYQTFRVANGWSSFTVVPAFAASVVAYELDGQNHLLSAFPTPAELMWQRPWFGGIGPVVAPAGSHFHPIHAGYLFEEQFTVEYPAQRDYLGARWQGVRLSADLRRPAGVRLSVEFLTLPGSNLLLATVRLTNQTRMPLKVQSFLGCYLRLNGDVRHTILRYQAEGEHNTRRAAYDVWLAPSADWAALESEPTGLTAALVSLSALANVQVYNLGLEGAHLFNVGVVSLAPGATDEYLTLFVLTDSAEKARRYRALGWSGAIGGPPEH